MNNYDGMRIWVSDIDGYVDLNAINREYEREWEEKRLRLEIDALGDIPLLAGKAISADTLNDKGIPPAEWRWAKHQAEQALAGCESPSTLERTLVRRLVALGKPYAIRRYAKWERVSYASAMTTTLPLGLRALCDQYLAGEGLAASAAHRELLRSTLHSADRTGDTIAYWRAGKVQSVIHQIARDLRGEPGVASLNRESTRTILSLTRLRFSIAELDLDMFDEVRSLSQRYEKARTVERFKASRNVRAGKRHIVRWRIQHLYSLLYFFPYAVRGALSRAVLHSAASPRRLDHATAVHELALASASTVCAKRSSGRRAPPR